MREPWCAWLVVVGLVKLSPVDSCIDFQADTLGGKSMYAGKLSAVTEEIEKMLLRILALTGIVNSAEVSRYFPLLHRQGVCQTPCGSPEFDPVGNHLAFALGRIRSWILKVLRHCRARQMKVALIRCLTMSVKKMMSKWTKQGSMLAYMALWLLEVLALATQPHACPAA